MPPSLDAVVDGSKPNGSLSEPLGAWLLAGIEIISFCKTSGVVVDAASE
jgi:hypothetical protein